MVNRALDAASVLVDRRARRAKPVLGLDRWDGPTGRGWALRTLMALERGETRVCRVVHVPSPEQEDARRRSRERARLVVERGAHASRIKGLLMTQGVRDFEPGRRDWQQRLDALRTVDGQSLAPCLQPELLRECRRLRQVMEMIAEVEAEQKAVAIAENGKAAQLAQLRGIGLTFATVLLASPHECGMLVRHPSRADRIQGGAADRRSDVATLIPIPCSKRGRSKEKTA
ncbi:MAG: hypothetical protein M3Y41_16615 [Pseudomonadota bacterium]|nr:hypothetical protein [Pseudomonadota bacterium]